MLLGVKENRRVRLDTEENKLPATDHAKLSRVEMLYSRINKRPVLFLGLIIIFLKVRHL